MERERKLESMALIVGSLSHENDPAVLEAISDEVTKHPDESVKYPYLGKQSGSGSICASSRLIFRPQCAQT